MPRTNNSGRDRLDVDRADEFLSRERAAQRVGLVVLSVFVLAGAAGMFGNGVLSTTVVHQGGTAITYERFTRQTVPTNITIAVSGLARNTVEIGVSRDFLHNLTELEVHPDNMEHRFNEDALVFDVPVTNGKAHVELRYKPRDFGLFRAGVGVNGAAAARFWQMVYF